MDIAAGWSASAHRPDHDGLSEKEHINFIEPHMWPPNSPDINSEWQKLSQRFIDNNINEWRRRLEAVIKNGGGHIEHCNLA